MSDLKRSIDEMLSIYLLEKDFIDLYVEGPTDKSIIENFFEYKGKEVKVIEIDTLDFSDYSDAINDLDLRSNKNKLIVLSRLLLENKIRTDINCVVDRDFDGILNEIEENEYLLYTGYSCMESYVFTEVSIKKILDVGIRNFPFNSRQVFKEISGVVFFLFIMRIVNEKFDFNCTFPKIENNLTANRTTGVFNFDANSYLEKFINTNKLTSKSKIIKDYIIEVKSLLTNDKRFYMNGHDFILILFHYINKIKNTPNFKIDTFERAVYLSIQPNHLDAYNLFQKIS